jgi:hypothetical protein
MGLTQIERPKWPRRVRLHRSMDMKMVIFLPRVRLRLGCPSDPTHIFFFFFFYFFI